MHKNIVHKCTRGQRECYCDCIGTAKLAAQAKSREKMIGKMVAGGMAERVEEDKNLQFGFPLCGDLAPPIIMIQRVSFRYAPDQVPIHTSLHLLIHMCCVSALLWSRVARDWITGLLDCRVSDELLGRVGVGLW